MATPFELGSFDAVVCDELIAELQEHDIVKSGCARIREPHRAVAMMGGPSGFFSLGTLARAAASGGSG